MSPYFADTSYWHALLVPHDQWHSAAVQLAAALGNRRIVTTEMVLAELLNGVSRFGPEVRAKAAAFLAELRDAPQITIVKQRDERFWDAVAYYASRLDQRWGLTDCASFIVMRERGITHALTADRDFAQAGFTILMQ